MNQENLNEIEARIKNLVEVIPEIRYAAICSTDGKVIASVLPEGVDEDRVGFMSGVNVLSTIKLVKKIELDSFNSCLIRTEFGYFGFWMINQFFFLMINSTRDIKLGLIYTDANRTIAILKSMLPSKNVDVHPGILEKKLNDLAEEFRGEKRIFFSYAQVDSEYFNIPKLATELELYPKTEVMFFQKSKQTGEDVLDYMQRGVEWCNIFIWFNSLNSLKSYAVFKEYKMAEFLGKRIIIITNDFNTVTLSARVCWLIHYDPTNGDIAEEILDAIENYETLQHPIG
ncbi:MAG: TIR domain-containing protein [Promethearchaeota archaeon]|nr:MAG: TIR domain-containing protein [Candidatus Lokiarchaeota archaeon]